MSRSIENPRRKDHVHVLLTVAIAVAFVSTTFIATSPEAVAQETDHIFWVGTMMEIDSLNPFTMTSITSYAICGLMFEYLYTTDVDGERHPQLAESYNMSEDGTVWTYYLVEDSYFHDGEQVTADDVKFTFDMVLNNPQDCSMLAVYLDGVTNVTKVNDFTIQLTLDEPRRGMLEIWIPILPEHQWSAVEADGQIKKVDWDSTNYFAEGFVGSGPFILDEYSQTQSHVRMLMWDLYNWGPANIDELYFKIYDFEDTMVNALETGSIDIALDVPVTHWDSTLANEDIDGVDVPSIRFKDFGFNCAPAELRFSVDEHDKRNFPDASTNLETTNLSVRQACSMAVNKSLLVAEAYQGHAVVGDSLVSTATPFWHYYVPAEEFMPFDLDKANETLENAGYRYINSTEIRENETSGVMLDFKLYYANPYTADQIIAEKVSEWLSIIGVNAPPTGVSEGTLNTMWFGMEYDIFIWDWWPTLDPSWILAVLTTDEIPEDSHDLASWSDTYYTNPYYDDLYVQQNKELDVNARQGIVHEMQAIAYHDCPYSILCYLSTLAAYRTDEWVYPDMTKYSVREIWFYFEVLPAGAVVNLPPQDVDAGPDQTADVGDELHFIGSADDPNSGDVLTYNWSFEEPDSTVGYREGESVDYTFLNIGEVVVTLTVTDQGGLSGSDEALVTVSEVAEDAGWLKGYVEDGDSEPIEGATVHAGTKTKVTTPEGFYNISISAGTYTVNVSATGFANATDDATVETGNVTWLNFTLTATSGGLTGHIYDIDSEEAIGNARIQLSQSGVLIREKYADSEGSYSFSNILAGDYNVTVTASGYEDKVVTVTVVAGESVTLDVHLEKESEDSSSIAAIIGGVIVLAIIVAVVVALMVKRRKKGALEGAEEASEEPTDTDN